MSLYCWGDTVNGELGLGGIEEEQILVPREMDWNGSTDVKFLACGPNHTLIVSNSGQLYSCGCNDFGQLGHELPRKRPQLLSALKDHVITSMSCGKSHSMAVNEWGQLFAWGSNSTEQLGLEIVETYVAFPKLVKSLATKQIVQIASGNDHNLALTSDGELYAWGSNRYGELGLGKFCENVAKPTLINSIAGIPIAFIACGGSHSFVLSKSGAVFGFGKNLFGQLGVNDERNREYPTQLKTLRNIGVRYIACGEDFSVFLTMDGGVSTCGLGAFGQLGHGAATNEILPRMVIELMGTTCTQISCGRRHALTFVPTRGRIYGFGLGCAGQLGNRNTKNSTFPQVVLGPWVSPGGSSLVNIPPSQPPMQVDRIYSGGDHSFASTIYVNDNKVATSSDYRIYDQSTQIASLSINMAQRMSQLTENESVDLDFMSSIEQIFKSLACMNGSFLYENNIHSGCSSRNPGVCIEQTENIFGFIRRMENQSLKQIIWEGITNHLLKSLQASPADVEVLRIYLTLPIYHEFINSKNYEKLHTPFSRAVLNLSDIPLKIISNWWAIQPPEYFERLVDNFKGVVMHIISIEMKKNGVITSAQYIYEMHLELALKTIKLLNTINDKQRAKRIAHDTFYLSELLEYVDLQSDYVHWISGQERGFNFRFHLCEYPFLFDAKAKTLLLQTDQAIQMQKAMTRATTSGLFSSFFSNQPQEVSQYVVFNVTRENLVVDTIREIMMCRPQDLKKPLKVKFFGEEAEDAGGVRKEFFMLLIKDLLDPKYGMFTEFEDSRCIWFAEHSFEDTNMYTLIGAICGLAIYNFIIVNIPFPLALYKKLLKEKVDINDLKDMSPIMAKSMISLLEYDDDDLEEVFDLTFEITREVFGEMKSVQLKADGDKIRVTKENRKEFVDLYVDYILNKSIEQQFDSFYTGFMKVCGGNMMRLFKAPELMAVVVGNEDYDWQALEENAEYKNGYSSGDQTVRWFWEVFHDLPLEEKKKFLLFLTGSDRIPIEGMKAIKIYIQPTTDDKFLPVAHTCFNLLDLPQYKTKEKLKYKLLQAIQQTQGFSLV